MPHQCASPTRMGESNVRQRRWDIPGSSGTTGQVTFTYTHPLPTMESPVQLVRLHLPLPHRLLHLLAHHHGLSPIPLQTRHTHSTYHMSPHPLHIPVLRCSSYPPNPSLPTSLHSTHPASSLRHATLPSSSPFYPPSNPSSTAQTSPTSSPASPTPP